MHAVGAICECAHGAIVRRLALMALGKSGEENRASLLVLCALFAHSCRGGIQMYSSEGGKGFSVLCDIVTSAGDL